jgi:hypothetical protein
MGVTNKISFTPPHLVACFCCGQSFMAEDITRFEQHPDKGVCPWCAEWLHNHSQPTTGR